MKNRSADAPSFAQWLTDQLTARGYNVTGLRSGGRSRFAADSGLSPSTVGRLLRGDGANDLNTLTTLANALNIPLPEILVRANVISDDELTRLANRHGATPTPLTPEQAADELGITDPQARRVYLATVEALRPDPDEQRAEQ
jgi:transcriptional regulator with XRE-family HTH domain